MRRLTVIFAILSLAMLLGGAMCSTQPARMKPKKFDLRFKVAPTLIGAAVEVDIIGASPRSHLPNLESVPLNDYWMPGYPLRREVPKATLTFGRGTPAEQREQTLPASDPKWNTWLSEGAEVIVVMAHVPGKKDRRTVSIDQREWGNVSVLEFLIQESGVQLVTAKPTK